MVKLGQNGVTCSMYVHRISIEAQLLPIHRQGFYFVQQYDDRAICRSLGNGSAKEVPHCSLASAESCTSQGMWLRFDESELTDAGYSSGDS